MGLDMFSFLPPSRASRALETFLQSKDGSQGQSFSNHVSMIKLSIDPQTLLPLQPSQTPGLFRPLKYPTLLQ